MIKDKLIANNFDVFEVDTGLQAKQKVLELIPLGSEVFTMSSVTLHTIGVDVELNSDKYNSVRNKLSSMDRITHGREMQKLGAVPEYAIGSAQAITEEGQLVFVSATGSQLPAYAYGAAHTILVISTKKIVPNLDAAYKRIYDIVLPLESKRAHEAYGVPGSAVNKILIINKETLPHRLTVILVKDDLGY